ncbi:Pantothenate synthetase [Cyphellophora attinorum]|uniref:Pantoate--beta-alanine ligase n=1 Tax=Cyphellophora attinorum TaxID=1664694 RepID=A0A0N0NKW6_9EURO|nr:Pantothenate synthetase [Phialophora attinorum]KPI38508.1 Pantothenate synthetase [Phialophora attinorum]
MALRNQFMRAYPLRSYSSSCRRQRHVPFTIFRDVAGLREVRRPMFQPPNKVGFVPTMGALHEGHLSLVRHALNENNHVFVSIFVNPTQFGVNEDLDSYPKTWASDLEKLKTLQDEHLQSNTGGRDSRIQGIFAPSVKTMYPVLPPSSEIDGDGSFVTITPLSNWLEGASRPVFFRGVATVCMKLFNIVQPDRVYFGQKDVQQSVLIRRMVKDFHIPTQVRVIETSRESDGLAMSSRNVYLGERRRADVAILSKALFAARSTYDSGETSAQAIRQAAWRVFDELRHAGQWQANSCKLEVDYIALSGPDDMATFDDAAHVDPKEGAILSAAMKVFPVDHPANDEERGQISVRLIDNVLLSAK